jgi:hypothetical protein
MRVLLVLIAIVALLAVAGWITFSNDAGRTSINIEKQEIREDTGEALHKGSELLQEAEKEIDEDENPNSDPTILR